jgi:hypothetical protein
LHFNNINAYNTFEMKISSFVLSSHRQL